MGYESTLIFGLYHPLKKAEKREREFTEEFTKEYGNYCQVVMTLDLSKMGYGGPFAKLLEESSPNTEELAIYYRDADNAERVDPYGDVFKVLDPDSLIEALEAELQGEYKYRRAVLALEVVKAWRHNLDRFNDTVEQAVILHYGH